MFQYEVSLNYKGFQIHFNKFVRTLFSQSKNFFETSPFSAGEGLKKYTVFLLNKSQEHTNIIFRELNEITPPKFIFFLSFPLRKFWINAKKGFKSLRLYSSKIYIFLYTIIMKRGLSSPTLSNLQRLRTTACHTSQS